MAYQFSALLIEGNLAEDPQRVFEQLGFPNGVLAGGSTFVVATNPTPGTRYLGVADGWTMLTDAANFVSVRSTAPAGTLWSPQVQSFINEQTADSRAFGFILSAVSNTYGFSIFENGEVVRESLITMGEMVVVDEGDPVPAEAETVDKLEDKQNAILLMTELLEVPFRAFETCDFQTIIFETQRVG